VPGRAFRGRWTARSSRTAPGSRTARRARTARTGRSASRSRAGQRSRRVRRYRAGRDHRGIRGQAHAGGRGGLRRGGLHGGVGSRRGRGRGGCRFFGGGGAGGAPDELLGDLVPCGGVGAGLLARRGRSGCRGARLIRRVRRVRRACQDRGRGGRRTRGRLLVGDDLVGLRRLPGVEVVVLVERDRGGVLRGLAVRGLRRRGRAVRLEGLLRPRVRGQDPLARHVGRRRVHDDQPMQLGVPLGELEKALRTGARIGRLLRRRTVLCHRALPSSRGPGRSSARRGGGLPIHENGTRGRSEAQSVDPVER
jgi:hypothetical protein